MRESLHSGHGSRITYHSSLLNPKPGAAPYAIIIRDDLNIRLELELDVLGVPAADVQLVEMGQPSQRFDRLLDALVPFLLAHFSHRLVSELLVIGLVFAKREMGDFQVRRKLTVHEQRRAEACPKRNDHLNPFAFD